jgi:hypothetical protein
MMNRKDIFHMMNKNWEEAEVVKGDMEEIQRTDHKLRENAKKRRKGY